MDATFTIPAQVQVLQAVVERLLAQYSLMSRIPLNDMRIGMNEMNTSALEGIRTIDASMKFEAELHAAADRLFEGAEKWRALLVNDSAPPRATG